MGAICALVVAETEIFWGEDHQRDNTGGYPTLKVGKGSVGCSRGYERINTYQVSTVCQPPT